MKLEYRRMALGYLVGAGAAALAFAALLLLWLRLPDLDPESDATWHMTVVRDTASDPWDEISDLARIVLACLALFLPAFAAMLVAAWRLKAHRATVYVLASVLGSLVYAPRWTDAFSMLVGAHPTLVEATFGWTALVLPASAFGYGYWSYARRHPPISEWKSSSSGGA